jgi:outer membrane protein TolC
MLYKNYSQMVRSEKVYRDNIVPKAKAALDVLRRGYSANENDFNDLISAELEYLMARMELATTRFERQKAFIETERLIGRSIKSKEKIKTVIIPSGEEK